MTDEYRIIGGRQRGSSYTEWLGHNPAERAEQIRNGSLRMVIVFGTERARDHWMTRWDQPITDSGARFKNQQYTWPNGAWLRLQVAHNDDTRAVHGMTFTDFEMDGSVGPEQSWIWRHVLETLVRVKP